VIRAVERGRHFEFHLRKCGVKCPHTVNRSRNATGHGLADALGKGLSDEATDGGELVSTASRCVASAHRRRSEWSGCPDHRCRRGESTLVDDLLARGYRNVSVLDLSRTALTVAQARIGQAATSVAWLCGDVTRFAFASHEYDVWHDRAVFHFLTEPGQRAAYVRQVCRAVKPGGHVIVATIRTRGTHPVQWPRGIALRAEALHDEFGANFQLVKHLSELHETPVGSIQQFTYCYCTLGINDSLKGTT
jgi:SAM-dependent methyltransferase